MNNRSRSIIALSMMEFGLWVYAKTNRTEKKICKFFTCIQPRQNLKQSPWSIFRLPIKSRIGSLKSWIIGTRKMGNRLSFQVLPSLNANKKFADFFFSFRSVFEYIPKIPGLHHYLSTLDPHVDPIMNCISTG